MQSSQTESYQLQKLFFKRCKRKAHRKKKKTTPQKDVLYVGFQEEATRQEIELQIQIQSLQKAIVYANARLQSPDKIILLNTLPI